MLLPLALLTTIVLLGLLLVALVNSATFPRLNPEAPYQRETISRLERLRSQWAWLNMFRKVVRGEGLDTPPSFQIQEGGVSILIPARNEVEVIGRTIRQMLAQTHGAFEVIVLDDGSEDGTAAEARAEAGADSRVRVMTGEPLPAGWLGKNWACHQLSQHARYDRLLFVDADVQWHPEALAALLAYQEESAADLVTVWPTQITGSWTERLVVPLMSLAIIAYLPLPAVHHLPWSNFAAANGQTMLFTRDAYRRSGGHAAVRGAVVEDVQLARRVKKEEGRLRMVDGSGLIGCRMYRDWRTVREGFGKNILAGHANSVPFLLLSTLFHWTIFLFPWVWLIAGPYRSGWPWWPLGLALGGIVLRAVTAAATRQRLIDALLMPLSVLLMTGVAFQALVWRFGGGPRWKGRTLSG